MGKNKMTLLQAVVSTREKYEVGLRNWESWDVWKLFEHLRGEVEELRQALSGFKSSEGKIVSDCADVANMAMMIADNYEPDVEDSPEPKEGE